MAMTLEQINEQRAAYGKEPLTELPKKQEDTTPTDAELEDKKKQELADAEAKKKADEEKSKTPPASGPDPELDDSKVLEYLRKKNPNLKSLDDLTPKPDADPEKEAEEREAAKISYGLQKGLFKKKDYDNFISDSKDPVNLVFDEYAKEARKEDPDLQDDEILKEFKTEYGLDAKEGTRTFNRGQQDLALRSQKILQSKYGKILSLDNDFTAHEATQKEQQAYEQKILTETPVKKKQIEAAFEKAKKITWEAGKDEVYELEYPQEVIDSVKKGLLDEKFIKTAIENNWGDDQIEGTVDTILRKAGFAQLLLSASDKRMNKHAAGSRGIVEGGNERNVAKIEPKLSENQKKMLEEYKAAGVVAAN